MPSQENARRGVGAEPIDMPKAARVDGRAPFTSSQALQRWFESRIKRELERCRACMSTTDWAEHHVWIEENARSSLREAVEKRVKQGAT